MSENITNNPSVPTQVVSEVKFPRFINNLGIIPTSYKDSMSYYETLAWLCKYLEETVIPTVNQNGQAVQELQGLYIQLQEFVTHYFDNLDVQTEINNKLDKMAQDGTLTTLIGNYVQPYVQPYIEKQNARIDSIENELSSIASGSPLTASSVAGMTDTTKVYVNTSNGYWYYYDGDSWEQGGLYLAGASDTFLNPNSINSVKNSNVVKLSDVLHNTGVSQGYDLKNSNINLKYKDIKTFYIQKGGFEEGTGIKNLDNTSRGISNLMDINGKIYIYNKNATRYDILEINPSNNTIHARLDTNYSPAYLKEMTCSSLYKYAILIGNEDLESNITDNDIKKANEGLLILQNPITRNEVNNVSQSNIFINPTDGAYIPSINGVLTNNATMCYCDYQEVNNREKLYITNTYVQMAFYDINKNYISGVNFHPANNQPTSTNIVVDIPNNAYYMRASTRLGNKKDLIISENVITTYYDNRNIVDITVPKHLVKPTDLINYVNLDLKNHPNDDLIEKSGATATDDGYEITNGYIRYYKNMKPDKEVMIFLFKTTDSTAIIGLGSDNSKYGTTINDAGLRVNIDIANKTMTALATNWAGSNTQKQQTSFTFDIDNGEEYCCRITKNSIYDVLIDLFNANRPNEVASIHLYTAKDNLNPNSNNLARMWGCPRFMVTGTATIVKMQMVVTLNQYPKVAVYGDSYAENHSRTWNASYIRQMENILGNEISISAGGGDTSTILLTRIKNELPYIHPKYCIIQTGANDYTLSQATYTSNMNNIISILESLDIIPILVTCPPTTPDTASAYVWINTYVTNSGYKYIDLYSCLTNDNGTQDTTKFNSDGIHPNVKGANSIMKYIEAHLPELLN